MPSTMPAPTSSSDNLHLHDPTQDPIHLSLSRAHTLRGDTPVHLTPSHSSTSIPINVHHEKPIRQTDTVVQSILADHVAHQLPPYPTVTPRRLALEARRPRWLRECIAEAAGVFIFVFCGLASVAGLTVAEVSDPAGASAHGSLLQVGLAMGLGVALAIITCAPTSGGHFNPAITLCMALWQDFSWRKVPRYVLAQILGALLAAGAVAALYWDQIQSVVALRRAANLPLVGPGSPASIFCSYPRADQASLVHVFLVELVADALIAAVVWAALDPANPFVHPAAIPFVIGIAYADMIWGFGGVALSTNLARDLGARAVAAMLFGAEAFAYRGYVWTGLLVNFPATLLGTAFYEFALRDSLMVVGKGHAGCEGGDEALFKQFRKAKLVDEEQGLRG